VLRLGLILSITTLQVFITLAPELKFLAHTKRYPWLALGMLPHKKPKETRERYWFTPTDTHTYTHIHTHTHTYTHIHTHTHTYTHIHTHINTNTSPPPPPPHREREHECTAKTLHVLDHLTWA
jgi:hypothetical protein